MTGREPSNEARFVAPQVTADCEMGAHSESIYVDTSAFYALMDRSDMYHQSAKTLWPYLLENSISLETSNYIVFESLGLLQNRLGYEAACVWYKDVLGVMNVHWVDKATHGLGYKLWRSLGRHRYSLVDCISYIIMHQRQIQKAFCFKCNYAEQGFTLLSPTS